MNLALFDFDGTITTRETFRSFIEFAVPPRRRALGTALLLPVLLPLCVLSLGLPIEQVVLSTTADTASAAAARCRAHGAQKRKAVHLQPPGERKEVSRTLQTEGVRTA